MLPEDVREERSGHNPSLGPPSGHWSSGTAQSSASHSTVALTVCQNKLREAPSQLKTSFKKGVDASRFSLH